MRQYFIHDGLNEIGPLTLDELKNRKITPQTQVWFEGMNEWKSANEISELSILFSKSSPPPFKRAITDQSTSEKTFKVKRSFSNYVIIACICGIALISIIMAIEKITKQNNRSENSDTAQIQQTYEEKKQTVEEIEISNPVNFLSVTGTFNKNFWGDKIKVHGIITSSATVAKYKDAVIRITYLSKTGTSLGSKEYNIYEIFAPNSNTKFELKVENYGDVKSIGIDLISATAVE
jgi:hypothetical protein